ARQLSRPGAARPFPGNGWSRPRRLNGNPTDRIQHSLRLAPERTGDRCGGEEGGEVDHVLGQVGEWRDVASEPGDQWDVVDGGEASAVPQELAPPGPLRDREVQSVGDDVDVQLAARRALGGDVVAERL